MSAGQTIYRDAIPPASHWSLDMRAGHVLRLIAEDAGANVAMLFYNPTNPLERYNAPDTLKCQHTFRLTAGHCLYSDMGRVFCSIVEDSVGWHDTVCGDTNRAMVARLWGEVSYEDARNERTQNGRDAFLVELGKYGLGKKDLAANVNWFSKVETDAEGNLSFVPGNASAGDYVDLRFEMDTLVLFHTCPHPLDPSATYPRHGIVYEIREAAPVTTDDACRISRPENGRGFENTALYQMLKA